MMHYIAIVLSVILLSLTLCSSAQIATAVLPAGRQQIGLAGKWRCQYVETPETQPGAQWTEAVLPGGGQYPQGKDAVWYERDVEIPAAWQSRRVVFHVAQFTYNGVIFLNGQRVGELPGYGGELDLTAAVQWGKTNSLRIGMGRLGKGVQQLDALTRDQTESIAQQFASGGYDRGTRAHRILGMPEEFYMESQPADFVITDVWYRTFTRGFTRIEPQLTIMAGKAAGNLSVCVRVYDNATGTMALEQTFAVNSLLPGRNEINVMLRADALMHWDMRQPNLYRGQVTLLDGNQQEVDRTNPVTFGVREFWTQGKDFYLNNQKIIFSVEWGQPSQALLDRGVTLVEPNIPWQAAHFEFDQMGAILECDRIGMGCAPAGVVYHWANLQNPDTDHAYAEWIDARMRRLRNHPSILMYGLGINSPGNFLDFSPLKIGRAWNLDWSNFNTSIAYQIHKRVMPSALYFFHGGPRGGDISTGNIYLNHMPTQEVEDWFSEWAEKGDMPIIVWEGMAAPLSVDYYPGGATGYNAIAFGDAAYAAETDEYIRQMTQDVPRTTDFWNKPTIDNSDLACQHICDAITRSSRAWRYYGVPYKTWAWTYGKSENGKKIDQCANDMLRPSLAWIGGPMDRFTVKEHNFFAGTAIEKSVMLLHDLIVNDTWHIAWEARLDGQAAPVATGQFTQPVGPYTRTQTPLRFTAPSVQNPTRLMLSLTVTGGDKAVIGRDEFVMTIYPRQAPPVVTPAGWAIIDPAGDTAAWLAQRGMHIRSYDPKAARPRVLLLGRGALADMIKLPYTASDIAAGMRVVIFEQHCNDLGKLGLQHEDCCPRAVYLRQPQHAVLAGITNEALHDWQGDGTLISAGPDGDRTPVSARLNHWGNRGTVASAIIETPQVGPFQTLLDCEYDLDYTPLMSWRHGAGEVIYCQLDLVGRVGCEPAATRVADNLLRYLQHPQPLAQAKTAVCFDAEIQKYVETRGFAASPLTGTLHPDKHVVVIRGDQPAVFAEHRTALLAFAKAGGDVLITDAGSALLADPAFAGRVTLTPARVSRAGKAVDAHPLLAGVGPQNIHWRVPVEMKSITSTSTQYTPLLNGLLGILQEGKGRIIFLQVSPQQLTDFSALRAMDPNNAKTPLKDDSYLAIQKRGIWQVNRLESLLFANLGLQSAPALVNRLFEIKREIGYAPVDAWMFLGPFSPAKKVNDAFDRDDLEQLGADRHPEYRTVNSRGETVAWKTPTDSLNGMGINGQIDLAKAYGIHLFDVAVAVTQIWSSQPREATFQCGADWWLKIDVNGKEAFRTIDKNSSGFGVGFCNPVKVHLKQGWNDIRAVVGAGSNGHVFWFRITNPGDLVVAQQTTAPAQPPANLPSVDTLIPDQIDPGFPLYTEKLLPDEDPYRYIPW